MRYQKNLKVGWRQSNVQSPFQKSNFGNSSQKTCKSRNQTFPDQSNFTVFLYFVPYILESSIHSHIRTIFLPTHL